MMIGSREETVFWKSIVAAVVPVTYARRLLSVQRAGQHVVLQLGHE